MELNHFKIDYLSLDITREKIEKFMGYDEGAVPEPFPELIEEVLDAT